MPETDLIWLSLLVFMPTLFAIGLLFFPRGAQTAMCWWTLAGTAVTLGLAIAVFINYKVGVFDAAGPLNTREMREKTSLDARTARMDSDPTAPSTIKANDYVARRPWIERFHIDYFLGIDGISLALILLTAVLFVLSMIPSFHIKRYEGTERFVRGYCMLFLILETGVLGTFVALDFFLFYIFWEVMLLPMYFLIGIWGGPRREYAAIKFFLYTLLGSVFILVAMLGFYFSDLRDFVSKETLDKEVDRQVRDATGKADEKSALADATSRARAVEIRDTAKINTFDIIALSRAGRAALEYMGNGYDASKVTTATAVEQARKDKDAGSEKAALAGLTKRLESEWFFKPAFQYTMFLFLLIGFAIKVPVFPFHTWLPDAHVEAPTPISMILAGILLKLGGYGIIRIAYPICPWAAEQLAVWVAGFGVFNIVYGAFAAMAQSDFKKLVAYSSISHMGYVILGIAVWNTASNAESWSWGMNGAMYQMIAHGVSSAGMFFCVGVIYDRAHHRNLDNFRGLYEPMPMYGGVAAIIFFAALGLPGLCGFIGEFMVVLSAWKFAPGGQQWVGITFSVLSALTVVLTAGYILWTIQRVFMGTNPQYKNYEDMTLSELACAAPLLVLCVVLGVAPFLIQNWMGPSVDNLIDTLVSFKQ